jgi:Bacteriophage minor capsid protein
MGRCKTRWQSSCAGATARFHRSNIVVLDDIGLFLQTQGLGTLATDIFKGRLPEDAPGAGVLDEIIALFAVPGQGPVRVHSLVGPGVEQPVVQVRLRGSASAGGVTAMWTRAMQAFIALDSVTNQTINGVFYQKILALQSPFSLPEDEWRRPTLIFNVLCRKAVV